MYIWSFLQKQQIRVSETIYEDYFACGKKIK